MSDFHYCDLEPELSQMRRVLVAVVTASVARRYGLVRCFRVRRMSLWEVSVVVTFGHRFGLAHR